MLAAERVEMLAASAEKDTQAAFSPSAPLISLGSGLSFVGCFLDRAESARLLAAIDSSFETSDWAQLPKRRLLNLGGVPHPSGSWSERLPGALLTVVGPRLAALGFRFDQILLNEYVAGAGISAHADGPLFEPRAAVISLGGDAILSFEPNEGVPGAPTERAALLLREGSLAIFDGTAYTHMRHSIADAREEAVPEYCRNSALTGVSTGDIITRPHRRLSLTLRKLARVDRYISGADGVDEEVQRERARRAAWWAHSISEKKAADDHQATGVNIIS